MRHPPSRRLVLSPILAAVVFALVTPGCGQTTSAPSDIIFSTMQLTIKDKLFTIEIADTPAREERGLMFRKSMPADHGMIFIFEKPEKIGFWMKNTLIPLDLVFLDAAGKVISIHSLKPNDETSVFPDAPASFAIELNRGAAANLGLKPGDAIILPEKILKPASPRDEK